ncbi:MAG: carboxypeptidase-like regulatory domain-containing protein [Bacteroidota bacterium]
MFFCSQTLLYAQVNKHTLSGIIRESGSGETLPGVSIYCDSLRIGVQSNAYGFYSLTLPEGKHRIKISALGFSAIDSVITFNQNLRVDFNVGQGIALKEVVVNAEAKKRIR